MDTYHHGELRAAALRQAATVIAGGGPDALNLRALAATLGVSHNAFRHHFGNREGLLTALATQGHRMLREALEQTLADTGSFLETGVSYVSFALAHPGHFAVMFRPDLLNEDEAALQTARDATFGIMRSGVAGLEQQGKVADAAAAVIAAWGLVHGIATLALSGNLDAAGVRQLVASGDVEAITRRAAGMLYGPDPEEADA